MFQVVAHEAEEGGYWGEVIGLPGCVSQGETLDELQTNMREAIEAVLESQIWLIQPQPITQKAVWRIFVNPEPGTQETWTAAS